MTEHRVEVETGEERDDRSEVGTHSLDQSVCAKHACASKHV